MRVAGRDVRRGSANTCSGKGQHKVQNRTRVNQSRNGARVRSGRETMGLGVGRHDGVAGSAGRRLWSRDGLMELTCGGKNSSGKTEMWSVEGSRQGLTEVGNGLVAETVMPVWAGGRRTFPRMGHGLDAVSGAENEMDSKPELSRK